VTQNLQVSNKYNFISHDANFVSHVSSYHTIVTLKIATLYLIM